ncbi:hypothetical protein OBBRIDRAFT_593562 [Obba rivulosa]|uniref:BTB domain-containing protein n=1 Tax=Obba rivulosa TaxID=1052685 RepID=A0A8E2B1M2_9APHY|nr:hypothetical protein OBBRIDRAFT_593562 [Obba rivulosa]
MSSSETSEQPPYASSPFDDPDADVIIRTSDRTDFRLYKVVLSIASPVFKDMLPIPQPDHNGSPHELRDGTPVVNVAEDKKTMDHVLRIIYPVEEPRFTSLEEVATALQVCGKYMMRKAQQFSAKHLLPYMEKEPLRVYAVACRFQLFDVAREAAKCSLQVPLLPLASPMPSELDHLPAFRFFFELSSYRQKCEKAALGIFTNWRWTCETSISGYVWFASQNSHSSDCIAGRTESFNNSRVVLARRWWEEYYEAAKLAVQTRIAGAAVQEPELLDPFFKKASACATCRASVNGHLRIFSRNLAQRIDNAVAKYLSTVKTTLAVTGCQRCWRCRSSDDSECVCEYR